MPTSVCYHVTTYRGDVYGAGATSKRDALAMVAERLDLDGSTDGPAVAERVGPWSAPYGTVLAY
jgi:hypothetical protein